jgi:hypothetical protein
MEAGTQQAKSNGRQPPPASGRWKPGQSGNPDGRRAKTPEYRDLERITRQQAQLALEQLVGPALAVLHRALKSKDQQIALRAAVDVIDRTQGKALQRMEGSFTGPETVTHVTPEMLRLAAQRLLAAEATDVETQP